MTPQSSDGRAVQNAFHPAVAGTPPQDALLVAPPVPALVSRDPSLTRGRASSSASTQSRTSRSQTPAVQVKAKQTLDIGPERRPSLSYGHHRQTSIVHGYQHSRNASLVQSTAGSPLSPQKVLVPGHVDGSVASRDELGLSSNAGLGGASSGTIRKSPSMSTLSSGGMPGLVSNGSRRSRDDSSTNTNKRPERMHSERLKKENLHKDHAHHPSQSRLHHQHLQDHKTTTVGEYALHHLFTSFIAEADERINKCLPSTDQVEPRIENILGPGADPAFDQLIAALGHIVRQKPKPLIDSLMVWRREKSKAATRLRSELHQAKETVQPTTNGTMRRDTRSYSPETDNIASGLRSPQVAQTVDSLNYEVAQADRRSAISVYILCRVLIEIIGQSTLAAVTADTAGRLEDVIYGQLISADAGALNLHPLKLANWSIFGQLLGVMSAINFEKVSDRFIRDLERYQNFLSVKGHSNREVESKTVLLVQSMKWLRVKSYPEDAWDRSCDLIQLLASFFAGVHGQHIKYAYCQLFEYLLLPIAGKATSELNVPKWREVMETIKPRLSQMLTKPKHWANAFPLMSILLCVSPLEAFTNQWQQMAMSLQPKLKERSTRPHALKALCRLVWRYIYKTSDTQNVTAKRLDEIIKMVFQASRRSHVSTEEAIAEPLIQLIRIIGFKHQDLCFRNIIFPLMNSEVIMSGRDLKADSLDPEKMVIGIRAFLTIMSDLENGTQPPFPSFFESDGAVPPFMPYVAGAGYIATQGAGFGRGKGERLSKPVITNGFGDVAKESYVKFCKILGEITIICDNTFGGQAVLDEKFSAHQTPKTPMAEAFSFARKDDYLNPTDARQNFYDLLHVAVQALPRCLSPHIPFNALVNLLCTGTAHVQTHIADSSARSLKSIARQSHAQQVTVGFARFIFNFDDRYSTVADGGLLGPGHIEGTLRLYVELLQIWIEDLQRKRKRTLSQPADETTAASRSAPLDLSVALAHVDEIESHGLFFLCSPSRRVRAFAVTVLRLVTKFDTALQQPNTRIISIVEDSSQKVIDVNDEKLSVAERSRLQKGLRNSNIHNTLVELCSSDIPHDSSLWFKVFPSLIRLSSEICPHAVRLTREIVCMRLSHSQRLIASLADGPRLNAYAAIESAFGPRHGNNRPANAPEVTIEQWKLHLIYACTTLTNPGYQPSVASSSSTHTRKSSKSSQSSQEKILTATELFTRVVPFLSVDHAGIRNAAVVGLGTININLYRTLLEALQSAVTTCNEEARVRLGTHRRTVSSPRRSRRTDHLRTEVTHLYKLTSHFLCEATVRDDEWIWNNLVTYTKDLRIFLNDVEVQTEWHFQKLRVHYCGLIEALYEGVSQTRDPLRWMSFQSRKAAFALMEDWCGYSPNQEQIHEREDTMRRSVLEREHVGQRPLVNASMEIEKRDLRIAALSAMAALCGGPVATTTEGKVSMQFDIRRMLSWIDKIFETPSDRTHATSRRALKNLILHNPEHPYLLERSVEKCYLAKSPKALASYFEVVTQVLIDHNVVTTPFWKILPAALYTLGNEKDDIRMKSARLLRTLEERLQKNSKLQDLDISVSDKTTAVYKLAQFEISRRLAMQHSELVFHVFSEFSIYFKDLKPDHQRNMVAAMLPWIQAIELQLDPNGGPAATSYMLLVNLFEITIRSSHALHNEIQALWQALATGPYAGNVQLILDFIIAVCLERKEQNFVDYAKQIVVFLSSTPAGLKVVEFLLLQICPKTMVVENREPGPIPQDTSGLPYIADLALILPIGSRQAGLSLGQVCLILLVDLVVSPIQLPKENIPLLLQVIVVQWDHYTHLVQDQAREMLVHLIHELLISKSSSDGANGAEKTVENLIELVRRHDSKIVWSYEDNESKEVGTGGTGVPDPMAYVIEEVVKAFATIHPTVRQDWSQMTLTWATSCAVRHIACRSFQIFRCILTTLDQQMLADMLARLSNTIADDENDYITFSLEILMTLRTIIAALEPVDIIKYPQLFWTTCACLDTIFEREYQEIMTMLERLLDKLDLSDPAVIKLFKDNQPPTWEGGFDGLQTLLHKGLRSSSCIERSLSLLERMTKLPSSELVGQDSRLLFVVLANLPRFLESLSADLPDQACLVTAETLGEVAAGQGHDRLARALQGFAKLRYRNESDFLSQTVSAIRTAFFPEWEYRSLVFLMGLLNNELRWFKARLLQLLCVIIPDIDMRKAEIASQGPDLISPLLRLLQTEFCQQALDVLDNVMTMTGTPLDNKHLRMSMAGSHSSRAIRKEYENTKSLYGIPESTGWSIPMPPMYSAQTRHNVHAVFYTCTSANANGVDDVGTPDIEFHADEFQYGSYFPDRTATMLSEEARAEGNMGDLVMKLDSLDDFFEDPNDHVATPNGEHGLPRYPSGLIEEREHLYDEQTVPILHKSLQRNASVTSFQTGFADMRYPSARDQGVMTPTAFRAVSPNFIRPGLHSRSVTSPIASNRVPPLGNDLLSGDEAGDEPEPSSDDDLSIGRAQTNDRTYMAGDGFMRPSTGIRANLRSGMRRLTGGGGDVRDGRKEAREALRGAGQKSPRVPKVPAVWLRDPKSADL
ncbi:Cell morphogenesis protein PAG1 [Elasticomyces elasticus]|nr:Cell morphogenesis protein PAG1 [Elasticomyces elasticus]